MCLFPFILVSANLQCDGCLFICFLNQMCLGADGHIMNSNYIENIL